MVRHEAAEALGSVAEPGGTLELLQEHTKDTDAPVSESCVVALDMYEYWSKFNNAFGKQEAESGDV